jgi:hypothetical protein
MKTCPFCKEEIRENAIKCRYCSSSLLPPQVSQEPAQAGLNPKANEVVYVLDQGLIRFGKFVVAVLAVFVACGIFFYGFDLKQTGEEVKKSADGVRQSAGNAEKTSAEILKARDAVAAEKSETEKLLTAARDSVASLQKQVEAVQAAEASMRDTAKEIESARKSVGSSEEQVRQLQENTRRMAADIEAAKQGIGATQKQAETLIASAVKSISDQQEGTRKLADDVLAAKDSVNTTKQQAEGLLERAQELVNSISEQQQRATTFVALIEKQVNTSPSPSNSSAAPKASTGLAVTEVARLYNFPAALDGRGQTIGLIELGGGIADSDLDPYFRSLKLARPTIVSVGVDGAKYQPTRGDGPTQFVTQSIEIVGAVAPAARIVVYFAPNTNLGFTNAIKAAANDQANHPDVLLIGWGAPESTWTAQAMDGMNAALKATTARGVTVIAAATRGDDFPSSSPWVLACGGTHFAASSGAIADSEEAWSGGGVSLRFPLPDWQASVASKDAHRRGPDVAALASPDNGYQVYIDGKREVTGGVTAAAALWAGLISVLNQGLGHDIGFFNPMLYRNIGPSGALRAVTKAGGEVKGCSVGTGWNTCSGWGTPDGGKLLHSLGLVSTSAK